LKELKPHHKRILLMLLEGKTASQIAKILKKSKATVSEHIKNLECSEFIIERLHSTIKCYDLTKKGKDYCSAFFRGSDIKPNWHLRDRSHNIKLSCKIIRDINVEYFSDWKQKPMKNWIKYSKDHNNVGVVKTPSSFLFQIPKMYYRDSKEALVQAGVIADNVCSILEKEYAGLVLDRFFQVKHQSHALVGDPVAQLANKNNVVMQGGRIELDASQYPEIEFTDKQYGAEDFEKYLNFIEPVLQGKISPEVVNNHNFLVLRDEIVKIKKRLQ
jgi:hypothetical protein